LGGRRKNYVPVHADFTNWIETRGFYEFGKYLELVREAEGYKEHPPINFSVPSVYWKITDHAEANKIKSWLLEQRFEITVPRFQNRKLLRGRFLYSKIEDSQSIKFERIVTRHVWEFRYDVDRFNSVDVGRYFPVVILKVPRKGSKVPKEVPVPVPVKSVIRRRK
jgi:hypothetical protein